MILLACEGPVFWLFSIGVALIILGVILSLIQDSILLIVGITSVVVGFILMVAGIGYQQYKKRQRAPART